LRELKEEAGVIGEIVERLSAQSFERAREKVVVAYFLVKDRGSVEKHENRVIRWEIEDIALQLLSFEEAKEALLEASRTLRSMAR
jgi:ADP-ribose pyrophosphatase YjhB (NUDIX family)